MQQMQERLARFNELRPSKQAFVDTRIPEHVRDIYNVIGKGVTEDAELKPAITAAEGFNITYVGAESGKGAALHSHTTVEVFIPLTGRWSVFWGDEGRTKSCSTRSTASPCRWASCAAFATSVTAMPI